MKKDMKTRVVRFTTTNPDGTEAQAPKMPVWKCQSMDALKQSLRAHSEYINMMSGETPFIPHWQRERLRGEADAYKRVCTMISRVEQAAAVIKSGKTLTIRRDHSRGSGLLFVENIVQLANNLAAEEPV